MPLGVPGGLRELAPGVLGATTEDGDDVLVVVRPGAPDDAERLAAARVASRPTIADALTLAVARRWADPDAGRAMPPVLLTASRTMAWLLAALVGIDLVAGAPVPLGPLVAVAAALALVAAGFAVIGRLGVAGAGVDEAIRIVSGPVVDVGREAASGDASAVARLEDLRAAWWAGPVDGPPAESDGSDAATAADDPWTVTAPDDVGLWATNLLGDAVYGPGVLGIRDASGRETLVVAPPDGASGWRRLVVLQMTGVGRRLETDDRAVLWYAVAPPETRGARAIFLVGSAAGFLVSVAVGLAAAAAADGSPVAWGLGAWLAFSAVSGGLGWWAIDRVARRACRWVADPAADLRERCAALRRTVDAEGPGGPGVADARRQLWAAIGTRGTRGGG